MSDFILINGDIVNFNPAFGMANVIVLPGKLKANGKATINGEKVCIDGDEKDVSVAGCPYTAGPYSVPGVGTLKIANLGGDQKAQKTTDSDKPVLLKGGTFTAEFEVQTPAQQVPPPPAAPVPDGTPKYTGTGSFITTNIKCKGT